MDDQEWLVYLDLINRGLMGSDFSFTKSKSCVHKDEVDVFGDTIKEDEKYYQRIIAGSYEKHKISERSLRTMVELMFMGSSPSGTLLFELANVSPDEKRERFRNGVASYLNYCK